MKNGKMVKSNVVMELETSLVDKHEEISMLDTPKVYVKQQQGFDYVDEGYMRHLLIDLKFSNLPFMLFLFYNLNLLIIL